MARTASRPKSIWVQTMTTAERTAITFPLGEPVWDVTIPELFIGDGATPGGLSGGMVGPQGPTGPTGPAGPNTVPSYSGAYGVTWSDLTFPDPGTCNIFIAYNSDTATYRLYFYCNGNWKYIEVV